METPKSKDGSSAKGGFGACWFWDVKSGPFRGASRELKATIHSEVEMNSVDEGTCVPFPDFGKEILHVARKLQAAWQLLPLPCIGAMPGQG